MTEITTKAELIDTLHDSNQRVFAWFKEIPAKDFFYRQVEVWSASDNVDHLIRSHKPIAKALKLPKITLHMMFGNPQKPSISYEELCKAYRDEIAKGAQASGRYLPNQESSDLTAELRKEELLDQYLLPHPILGKLTIREMLLFTIYHNLRHASQSGD
jgi:uncharacterized damage-inducible protein DinB